MIMMESTESSIHDGMRSHGLKIVKGLPYCRSTSRATKTHPQCILDAIILDVPQHQVTESMAVTGQFMQDTAKEWFSEVPFAVDGT